MVKKSSSKATADRFIKLYEKRKKTKLLPPYPRDSPFSPMFILQHVSRTVPRRTPEIFAAVREDWGTITDRRLWFYLSRLQADGWVVRVADGYVRGER